MESVYAVGLMSGTSADGIDAALVELIGPERPYPGMHLIEALFVPFEEGVRQEIFQAFQPDAPVVRVGQLDRVLGERFAQAANQVIDAAGVTRSRVRVIGSHGQTIAHYPDGPTGFTWQIGSPEVIAARTGITVASGFRMMDVALGGQGAPLVPYVDWALLSSSTEDRVVLNIGGIANVTVLKASGTLEALLGYDTGPGNMVLDGAMSLLSGGVQTVDLDGACARKGQVHQTLLARWLAHPFFARRPPKSTGREQFGLDYVRACLDEAREIGLPETDLLRTLTGLVAESIAQGIRLSVPGPFALIASGGGVRNPVLMEELAARAALSRPWQGTGDYGLPEDAKEAMAFAYLAFQLTERRPTSMPAVTGGSHPHVQGTLTPVDRRFA